LGGRKAGLTAPAAESGGEMELQVFLNDSAAKDLASGQDLDAFADEFAGWVAAPVEGSRQFNNAEIELLLMKMEQDPNTATVFGFHEFPYTAGGTLQGPDMQIEREYWLQLNTVDKRCVEEPVCCCRKLMAGLVTRKTFC
jgi:hypothetical protein